MINQISYTRILETIYALSAVNRRVKDLRLPGPLGADDAPALEALARTEFENLCTELGSSGRDGATELPADCHVALEEIVTDRLLARLTDRGPAGAEKVAALKRRLRRGVGKDAHGFF